MRKFHHHPLPDHSSLLSGRVPPNDLGFQSDNLQIWFNNTEEGWCDPAAHVHEQSDECFIVLRGELVIEVNGDRRTIRSREFCCFPCGMAHAVIDVSTPIETLMIRAPSIEDKRYV